jgi:soluble lytic murein transglycosylase-like protein
MNKNKKLLTAGIWLYGLAVVSSNQPVNDNKDSNVIQETSAPIIINEQEDVKYIETPEGFKKLHRVVQEAPTLKPIATKKPKATEKPKATKKPNKKSSATKSPAKTKSSTQSNSTKLYQSIPLSSNFQKWIDDKCKSYGISTNVVMGVIKKESSFTIKAMGDNGEAFGLMQIQRKWHRERMKKVGATNLLNCYDNVAVGIDYLAELYRANGRNWHKTLMAYNGGQAYANRRTSTYYSTTVMQYAENFKKERND